MKTVIKHVSCDADRAKNVYRLKEILVGCDVFTNDNLKSFDVTLELLRKYRNDSILYVEDDAFLCNDFVCKSNNIINKHQHHVVQFMDVKKTNYQTMFANGSTYCMNVCVYIPKWMAEFMCDNHIEYQQNSIHPTSTDMFLRWCLVQNKSKYLSVRPNLAQHLPFNSIMHKGASRGRKSIYFIDDYEKGL